MLNKLVIMGRLVADPKIATTKEGKEYAAFSIAVQTAKEETSFFECIAPAHCVNGLKLTHKGDRIAISGWIRQRKFKTKDDKEASIIQIVVDLVEFVDVKKVEEDVPF